MDNHSANEWPGDILILVLQSLQDDYQSLFQCALVNRAFNQAASKFLYRKVVFSPRYDHVSSQNEGSDRSNLKSATLPSYAKFVELIEISRYLPLQTPAAITLSKTIADAITKFKNLRVAILAPTSFHEDVFTDTLKYLSGTSFSSSIIDDPENPSQGLEQGHEAVVDATPPILRELVVNTSCTDEAHAPLLIQITGLSKLSIHSPTRAILQLLSDWLRTLSDTLTELHLKDNCGSVTPGVLRSFTPFLEQNIQSLSLGLSYSLTHQDVFSVLHQLQNLQKVELRYYWQLRQPTILPRLERLRSFTVYHINYQTRFEVRFLCKWIRQAITSSPLESLHIIQDADDSQDPDPPVFSSTHSAASPLYQFTTTTTDDDDNTPNNNTGANISFRGLIDHICACHSKTLKVLDMKKSYIDVKSLNKLFENCLELEEMYICAGRHALSTFKKHASSFPHLHTASFNIRNIRPAKRRVIDMELLTAIMKHDGPPLLRRLSVNGQSWEGLWKHTTTTTAHSHDNDDVDDETPFALHIHKYHSPISPWNKKYVKPHSPPRSPSPPLSASSSEEEEEEIIITETPQRHYLSSTDHFTPLTTATTATTTAPPPKITKTTPTGILTTLSTKYSSDTLHVRFKVPKKVKSTETNQA